MSGAGNTSPQPHRILEISHQSDPQRAARDCTADPGPQQPRHRTETRAESPNGGVSRQPSPGEDGMSQQAGAGALDDYDGQVAGLAQR